MRIQNTNYNLVNPFINASFSGNNSEMRINTGATVTIVWNGSEYRVVFQTGNVEAVNPVSGGGASGNSGSGVDLSDVMPIIGSSYSVMAYNDTGSTTQTHLSLIHI